MDDDRAKTLVRAYIRNVPEGGWINIAPPDYETRIAIGKVLERLQMLDERMIRLKDALQ